MRILLEKLLTLLAQLYIWRYRPVIVAVTGNVGKTSTKEAIAAALAQGNSIRVAKGNLNTELGVPLAILSSRADEYYAQGGSPAFWLGVTLSGFFGLFFRHEYPRILVLEYGADKPGDISRLASLFPPHVAVVSGIGQIPVHVEFFASPQALADEKSRLLEPLKEADYAILNFDDLTVLEMSDKTKAQAVTFGFGHGADIQISDFKFLTDDRPRGIQFTLQYDGGAATLVLNGTLGRPQALACAAAAAVAVALGGDFDLAAQGLAGYKAAPGRMRILNGIKNSTIIDDSYNASPLATHSALDALQELPAKRKMAVLGDMLELGEYSEMAHRAVGDKVGEIADILVCVGEKAKFIADSASNEMPQENILIFHTSDEAKAKVQALIQEGDLIFVKGSQGKRMEKIVEEIMAEPERKTELLVRQNKRWLAR